MWEGGMQEVYRAKDLLLSREVALKALKNASAEKRFKRSAVVSAIVNHANVARTLDYVLTPKRPYLIEEFVDVGILGRFLSRFIRSLILIWWPACFIGWQRGWLPRTTLESFTGISSPAM
jgi:serine/threonine protein kinase